MIKLVDQLSAMGSFPIATAQDIVCSDNIRLQEKIDNGTLGGGGGSTATTLTQEEYDALDPQEQLEGEFYCYDSARHFRNGVEYGKDAYFTSLSQLGLTAPTTVGEVFMAMPEKSMLMLNVEALVDDGANVLTVTDVPAEYGVLTIDKWSNSRFRIEFNTSREGSSTNIKQWIGTLKGTDGTGLKWKELATMDNAIETIANPTELDTNKFLKSGYYSLGDARDRTNLPIQRVGTLLVFNAGYYIIQEYILNENQRAFMRKSIDKGTNWSDWKELATMDKVADVPNTVIVSEDTKVILNSSCYYTVINGVCYVSLWGFQCTETGQYVVNSSMPKTRLTMKGLCTYGRNGYEGGCAFVFYDNNGNNKLYVEVKTANEPLYGSFSYPVAES